MAEEAGEGERRGVRGGAPNMPKKALGGCVGTASPRGTVRELLCKRLRRECRTIDKHQHGGGGGERQIERQLIRFLEGKSALPAAAGQAGCGRMGGGGDMHAQWICKSCLSRSANCPPGIQDPGPLLLP